LENVEAFYEKVCETIEKSEKELFEGEPTDGLKVSLCLLEFELMY